MPTQNPAAAASSAASATGTVTRERRDRLLVVTIDHPPVNALSVDVRRGLLDAIDAAAADDAVDALLIVGAGRNFIAGADIREFGKPPQPPTLPDVCRRIEDSAKPVIAALHGATLGGGLEVALAAHYRIALPGATLGLPEVLLGLLPGAGGTQRTPRLIGAAAALDLMLSGRHVPAKEALALGLVDRVAASDDTLAEGIAHAQALLAERAPVRRTRDAQALADRAAAQAAIDAARADVAKRAHGLFSPQRIVDAVEAALVLPFDEGMKRERELFVACLDSPQRAGLIHAFFAEREAAKVPGAAGLAPRTIARAGVIGGGTMGAGIAVAVLDAGLPVTMIERDDTALAQGRARVAKVYDALVAKGRLTDAARDERLARLAGSTVYDALADADLVIEAVFENMEVKQAVFAELAEVARPGAVLATNTSYLDIDAIAAAAGERAGDVIGLHFFSPANVMKLLEIVVPARVSPDVVGTAFAFAKRLRKVAVRAGVCDGFIGNRLLAVYRGAADHLMEDGASPYQIDRAIRAFGFPMGPYQVIDLAGGDIGWATRKRRAATRDPAQRYVAIADRLCERGWFGQKTQRGFYRYPEGARVGQPDPEVEAIVAAERAARGIVPREFSDDEIVRRYLAAMINEAANVLHEQIALRPLDVDVVLVHGYGFPRHRGGPLHYADTLGLDTVLADIRRYAQEDPVFWRASPLLEALVARGERFESLNRAG